MKVSDLKIEDIKVGLRIKSLIAERWGTITRINEKDDYFCWIEWDDDTIDSGFYGNDCECEVGGIFLNTENK